MINQGRQRTESHSPGPRAGEIKRSVRWGEIQNAHSSSYSCPSPPLGVSHAGLLAAMEQRKNSSPKIARTQTAQAEHAPRQGPLLPIPCREIRAIDWAQAPVLQLVRSSATGPKADGDSPRFGKYAGQPDQVLARATRSCKHRQERPPGKQMPPWKEFMDARHHRQFGRLPGNAGCGRSEWK